MCGAFVAWQFALLQHADNHVSQLLQHTLMDSLVRNGSCDTVRIPAEGLLTEEFRPPTASTLLSEVVNQGFQPRFCQGGAQSDTVDLAATTHLPLWATFSAQLAH